MTRAGALSSSRKMTMAEHIREIQTRFFGVAAVFIAGATLAYVFRDDVVRALLSPLGDQTLIYLNPAGGFSFILLVSLYCGLFLATPLLIHQIYSFTRPMLPTSVQRYSLRVFFLSLFLLISGATFGYFMAVPGALNFLSTFAEEYIVASLTADSYLNFIVAYAVGLGIVFQLPLLLMLIHWIKPLTPGGMLRSERWVIILAFIAAAIITPTPDPINQAIVAAPIILLYQFGVMGVLVSIHKTKKNNLRARKNIMTSTLSPARSTPMSRLAIALASEPAYQTFANSAAPSSTGSRLARPVRSVDGFRPVARPVERRVIMPERPVYARENIQPRAIRSSASPSYLDGISRVISI